MKRHIPNILTIVRFFLAIVFFVILGLYDRTDPPGWPLLDVATGLFLVAVIMDVIDGHIARSHGTITTFGRIADPFVDKITIAGALVFLIGENFAPDVAWAPWMVVVILAREILVTGMRSFSESHGIAFSATWSGKVKMLLQCIAVTWSLVFVGHVAGDPSPPAWLEVGMHVAVWAATLFTGFSCLVYVKRGARLLTMPEPEKETP